MRLNPDIQLGHYVIVEPIGAGGMGEVYRARDETLGRDVAIKVLPDALSEDAERLARFEREAKLLATLNHPGIATVHGFERSGATRFLVMELVEGETLAERIARGPVPFDEALTLFVHIAEAVEAAHAKGVVHRDLKPANIMITPDGKIKILDFGLAKALATEAAAVIGSQSPTLTKGTAFGTILETAAYMSPEQARGKNVDARTDVWALGCCLFEALTGRKAFEGETTTDVLSAILSREPNWKRLPGDVSPRAKDVIQRCLRKDVRVRIQHIGDARVRLEEAGEPGDAVGASVSTGSRSLLVLAALGGAVLAALATTIVLTRGESQQVSSGTVRFTILGDADAPIDTSAVDTDIAISPDGQYVAYVSDDSQIHVRALNKLEGRTLTDLGEGVSGPFFSPDSRFIGYYDDGANEIRTVSLNGGAPESVATGIAALRGATWMPDDTIVFATAEAGAGLFRVSATGGDPEPLTTVPSTLVRHWWPSVLPNGRAILFNVTEYTARRGGAQDHVAVLDLESGEHHLLFPGTHPRFAPSQHIVFVEGGLLRAVNFDPDGLEAGSEPATVVQGVLAGIWRSANFDIAHNGTLIYMPGPAAGPRAGKHLVWVDRLGREERLPAEPRAYTYPQIAPDGSMIAVDIDDEDKDIWLWDIARETLNRFTFDTASEMYPRWSPDGKWIAFASTRSGERNIFRKRADGTGVVERLTESSAHQQTQAFTPDGQWLVSRDVRPDTGMDIVMTSMTGERQEKDLLATETEELNAEISPDGRWLAYESEETGQSEIYMRPFPDIETGKWQISRGGGTKPLWRRDGQELFFLAPRGRMMAVPVELGESFSFGRTTELFRGEYFEESRGRTYDITPDGERFIMVKYGRATSDSEHGEIVTVLNWAEELERLLPAN